MLTALVMYLALGAFAGVLAGLLGIGGGLVIVPMLSFMFSAQGLPDAYILHLALGTSLATIIFTSISSLRAHHQHGAVKWPVFWRIAPGIVVGTFLGSWIAAQLSTNFLKGFFACFLFYVGVRMLRGSKPKPARQLPGTLGIFGAGSGIGIFSSLVGIGGGTLSVPFLVWCNVTMHMAIGTAAAIGLPIAVAGSLGYVINGLGTESLPWYCLGFVHVPALVGIILASVLTAPFGARLAHTLPVAKLKKIFAVLLLFVGLRMLWTLM